MSSITRPHQKPRKGKRGLVFGVPLDPHHAVIPSIIRQAVGHLETPGRSRLEQEGLFRISGNQSKVLELRSKYDKGEDVDLSEIADTHVVAGLVKLWFRELPEALCTFELYDMFLAAIAVPNSEIKISKIRQVLGFLPRSNLVLLKFLVFFLARVASYSHENKMKSTNLALVFGPNILRPEGGHLDMMIEDTPYSNELMTLLIDYHVEIFEGISAEPDMSDEDVADRREKGSRSRAMSAIEKAAKKMGFGATASEGQEKRNGRAAREVVATTSTSSSSSGGAWVSRTKTSGQVGERTAEVAAGTGKSCCISQSRLTTEGILSQKEPQLKKSEYRRARIYEPRETEGDAGMVVKEQRRKAHIYQPVEAAEGAPSREAIFVAREAKSERVATSEREKERTRDVLLPKPHPKRPPPPVPPPSTKSKNVPQGKQPLPATTVNHSQQVQHQQQQRLQPQQLQHHAQTSGPAESSSTHTSQLHTIQPSMRKYAAPHQKIFHQQSFTVIEMQTKRP